MPARPHVVWITLDSVRADHTSMEGYRRDTTPTVTALANRSDGAYFPNCFAHGKYTLTSTTSILTGTVPTWNRVGYERSRLGDDAKTVAERFRDAGYRTGGFSSNRYVSGETGLDRGFDRFAWLHPSTLLGTVSLATLLRYGLAIRRHSAGFQTDPYKHATPYLLTDVATHWLSDVAGDDPVFTYVHYNEPHRPYYPPLPYLDEYTDEPSFSPRKAGEFSMHVHENVERFIAEGRDLSEDELAALEAMYDAEISYTDAQLARLVERVRSMDDRPVVFVVTADHGELFGEYGLLGHKFVLRDELTRVPLVVNGMDLDGIDADGLVQHADVAKTILASVGADVDGIQGVDLRRERRPFAVSQHHETDLSPYYDHVPDFDLAPFHEPALNSIRTRDHRLVLAEDGAHELYELPDQTTDVRDREPELASRLKTDLASWLDDHTDSSDDVTEADGYSPEMREHLADMGYLEE